MKDLKKEKTTIYEEKIQIIKDQKDEIDGLKSKFNGSERDNKVKLKENEELRKKIEEDKINEENNKSKILELV